MIVTQFNSAIFSLYKIASCSNDQIRLIGDLKESNGRVEICSDQRWETLNVNQWIESNAMVACFELGFSRCELYIIYEGMRGEVV